MKICVFGMWHLGCVISACLADKGFNVIGFDYNNDVIGDLNNGKAPLFEPGLDFLINKGLEKGNLEFTVESSRALEDIDVLWVAFDTPVDCEDKADVEFIHNQILSIVDIIKNNTVIIISSQVPVGFTRKIEEEYKRLYPNKNIIFSYSPENLRLGKAIQVFENPDRIVIGTRNVSDRKELELIFGKISNKLEYMTIESAEMTKHAINAFLATSVSFANEIATICELVGVNAREVERGLKTEERIGYKAYVRPGAAFAGGTLARDIMFLNQLGTKYDYPGHLLNAVKKSNDYHKSWIKRKLENNLKNLNGSIVTVLGLTYKADTSTLRRSYAVELCEWLLQKGAKVCAFDPYIKEMEFDGNENFKLYDDLEKCVFGSECLVISTNMEILRNRVNSKLINSMKNKLIIDENGFLDNNFLECDELKYIIVGRE